MVHRTYKTRVVFANIPSDAPEAAVRHGFAVASRFAHILLVVESHMRDDRDYLSQSNWNTFQNVGHQTGRCSVSLSRPIFGNTGRGGTHLLNRANGMKFPGATRYAQGVHGAVDLRTGRKWNPSAAHLVPHADKAGESGVITNMPRGRANVIPAIRSIVTDLSRDRWGNEIGGMDANIDLDGDLRIRDNGFVEQLRTVGLYTDVQALGPVPDTHGNQEYDWLYGRFVKGVKWRAHGTMEKLPYLDHRFRWVDIESTVRSGWAQGRKVRV